MKPTAAIRTQASDFVVEEIPAYEPSGEGAHVFLQLRKTGLTTLECVRRLAARFRVDPRDIGYAGMKDRYALTTQWFSLPDERHQLAVEGDLGIEGVEVLRVSRHNNKLRTGHLEGNRFRLVLRELQPVQAAPDVCAMLMATQSRGVPNAFGPQRFGRDGSNPQRALAWLRGQSRGPSAPREKRLLISSVQSMLFDEVLRRRVEEGTWGTVLEGDLVERHDAASPTGPIFGPRMRWPSGHPAELEREVLDTMLGGEAELERFGKLGQGSRRALRLLASSVSVSQELAGQGVLIAEFVLPRGAYATTLLSSACELVDASRRSSDKAEETTPDDELLQPLHTDSE